MMRENCRSPVMEEEKKEPSQSNNSKMWFPKTPDNKIRNWR